MSCSRTPASTSLAAARDARREATARPLPGLTAPHHGLQEIAHPTPRHPRHRLRSRARNHCLYRPRRAEARNRGSRARQLASFMTYGPGHVDQEQRAPITPRHALCPDVGTRVPGTKRYPCLRAGHMTLLARPEGFEPPTAWFVAGRTTRYFANSFHNLACPNCAIRFRFSARKHLFCLAAEPQNSTAADSSSGRGYDSAAQRGLVQGPLARLRWLAG